METFTVSTGIAVPLRTSNVDTDQILPAEFLKRITRTGFEDGLFASWRTNSDFLLDQPVYNGASILVAGPDFGTGSSREHAVWALQNYGFNVVIASRFGDIFRSNAGKSGLLAAVVVADDIELLWVFLEAHPGAELTVDLQQGLVTSAADANIRVPFEIDEYTRWRLLNGLDDIAISLQSEAAIAEYEGGRSILKPSLR